LADIFISYSSEDRDRLEPLVDLLEAAGYSVWWDNHLRGGSRFSKEIEHELDRAKAVPVAWTGSSVESRWVADEADSALKVEKLVPICFDDTPSPLGFRQIQTIDFSNWAGEAAFSGFDTLIRAIAHHTRDQNAKAEPAGQSAPEASIAVLPFVNMSSDPEQEYFSDGISEELLNLLAKINALHVTARTSSFEFKGKNQDITRIGELLNVAYLLEGSVRKASNRVRITAQLIEVATGYHVWSETYDRTLDDVFAIQDEISAAIVEELKPHLLPGTVAPQSERSENLDAYELYLIGKQKGVDTSHDRLLESTEYYQRSLAVDPNFAPSLVQLAYAKMLLTTAGGYGYAPLKETLETARGLLDQAAKLAPDNNEVYEGYSLYYRLSGDIERSIEQSFRAVEINPNSARAYNGLSISYAWAGKPDAPRSRFPLKAVELNPLSPIHLGNMASQFLATLQFDQSLSYIERAESVAPESGHTLFRRMEWFATQGRYCEALAHGLANQEHFLDSLFIWTGLPMIFLFGEGEKIELTSPMRALYYYMVLGSEEDADRVRDTLKDKFAPRTFYMEDLLMALSCAKREEFQDALDLMRPYDKSGSDEWGPHFNKDHEYVGVMLSIHLREELGDDEATTVWLRKAKRALELIETSPDGPPFWVPLVSAYCHLAEGDRDRALDQIEHQAELNLTHCCMLKGLPFFDRLRSEPRFQAVISDFDALVAQEKEKATAAGLLPLDGAPFAKFVAERIES
jgi:adenylate cyclase